MTLTVRLVEAVDVTQPVVGNNIKTEVVLRPYYSGDSTTSGIAMSTLDLGFPTIRESVEDSTDQDGVNDITMFHGSRTVSANLTLLGPNRELTEQTLRELCQPRKRIFMYVDRDNWSSERRMLLRASNFSFVSDKAAGAMFKVALSFSCPSGRMEAANSSSVELVPTQSATNGFRFPMSLPLDYGFSSGVGTKIATNNGNSSVSPYIYIYGPTTAPKITNRTTKTLMSFTANGGLVIPQGHFVVVDTAGKRVLLDGSITDSKYKYLDFSTSTWMTLESGDNQIELVSGGMGNGSRVVLVWRDSWV